MTCKQIVIGAAFLLTAFIGGMLCSPVIYGGIVGKWAFYATGFLLPVFTLMPSAFPLNCIAASLFPLFFALSFKWRQLGYAAAVLPGCYWLLLVFFANSVPWD